MSKLRIFLLEDDLKEQKTIIDKLQEKFSEFQDDGICKILGIEGEIEIRFIQGSDKDEVTNFAYYEEKELIPELCRSLKCASEGRTDVISVVLLDIILTEKDIAALNKAEVKEIDLTRKVIAWLEEKKIRFFLLTNMDQFDAYGKTQLGRDYSERYIMKGQIEHPAPRQIYRMLKYFMTGQLCEYDEYKRVLEGVEHE